MASGTVKSSYPVSALHLVGLLDNLTGGFLMKVCVLSLTSTQQSEFDEIVEGLPYGSGYIKKDRKQLPSAIPESLRQKFEVAMLMFEKTTAGHTYIVCNGIRYDEKANALDQEPFGVSVHSTGSSPVGYFIHHGEWRGRSVPIASEIGDILQSTGLGEYFPLAGIPSASSGPLSDLSETSQGAAFKTMMTEIVSRSTL
jgi:hypothetical protein